MRSLKEIMNKTASHGGRDVAIEERREQSTVDAIDDQFLSWMAKKASEDVVKIADCGAEHGKMKAGEKCRVCGEENKAAAKTAGSCQEDHSRMKAGSKCRSCGAMAKTASAEAKLLAVLRGGATGGADAIAPEAMKVLNSARRLSAAKGMLAGAGLTAGGGALYAKGRRDQRAKTAGIFGGNEHTRRIERALRSAEKKTGKKTEDLKGWELMRAMDESRPERAKTAGVIENPENLDLLSRVRALAAAQNRALIGDDG